MPDLPQLAARLTLLSQMLTQRRAALEAMNAAARAGGTDAELHHLITDAMAVRAMLTTINEQAELLEEMLTATLPLLEDNTAALEGWVKARGG
ncbi:hypothetical protein [Deinococcus hopiensis]|uniref:Uncharacterized protein n=1 Tax=Deinococcus hopiensis KR-140 TaxID=695939 RepID=A0A1W1VGZ6_9DEIO|nr:hypothetical protein [Deinococcus hopiensis]SMB92659.1 hypothetical protein SAMN00790413_01677 [Deinococcus hopiensis KR-140]